MTAPVNVPAGRAGVAARAGSTIKRRGCVLLGALLLASSPGLARAGTSGSEEWPTTPDRGPRTATRIPWLRFSGDPTAQVVMVPGQAVPAQQVVVVREAELSRRQARLLRRAERHAAKAAELRRKAGERRRDAYAVVVPVVQATPPAPPRTVVVEHHRRPNVQVVHLDREHAHEGCDEHDHESELAEVEALEDDEADEDEGHPPVVIDVERLSADVERQVERALRDAERAREQAGRAREQAGRARERAHEQAERGRERSQRDAERGPRGRKR
jgi:hypothetical protein